MTSGVADETKIDFELTGKKIFVCGHKGMVGQAVVSRLQREECEVLTADRNELDLRDDRAVGEWFEKTRPNAVILPRQRLGAFWRMTPCQYRSCWIIFAFRML